MCRKSGDAVGADPSLTGASTWLKWAKDLKEVGLDLVPLSSNPIDAVWNKDRPERNREPLHIHETKFAGIFEF